MTDAPDTTIPGIAVVIDEKAVRVTSERPLAVLSAAVVCGGLCSARDIVNIHVDKDYDGESPEDDRAAFAVSCGVGGAFVGLMTAAYTEHACVAAESRDGVTVAAVVSVGLSNTSNAGITPPLAASPGTINAILLVDAALTPSAMVNAVITATEAKTMTLAEWDVRTPQGDPAQRHLDGLGGRGLHAARSGAELRRPRDHRGLAGGPHGARRDHAAVPREGGAGRGPARRLVSHGRAGGLTIRRQAPRRSSRRRRWPAGSRRS